MSQDEITLVCEGVRDLRWLPLVLGQLAETFEMAGRVRVVSAGSKADLAATVRGLRESRRTRHVYAIRDRDFLRAELLAKGEPAGVYSLQRHCLESYLIEPELLEVALGFHQPADKLLAIAERRFWADVAHAVLDALGYELRKGRLHLDDETPSDKAEVALAVKSKLDIFRADLAAKPLDVEALVALFESDMRSDPVWTRVNGKALMKSFAGELEPSMLPGGDLEARLFKWCSSNGPPQPLIAEMKRLLESFF
jgi:hypothetical protein